MNPPPPGMQVNQYQSEELKKYLLVKQGKGPLFIFLYYSAIVFLVMLITVLKPHRLYKKFLVYVMELKVAI